MSWRDESLVDDIRQDPSATHTTRGSVLPMNPSRTPWSATQAAGPAPADVHPALLDRYLRWAADVEERPIHAADLTELSVRTLLDGESLKGLWVMLEGGYRSVLTRPRRP